MMYSFWIKAHPGDFAYAMFTLDIDRTAALIGEPGALADDVISEIDKAKKE